MKQDTLQWLQDPGEINGYKLKPAEISGIRRRDI
jgi:hypothetical protein